MSTPETTVSDSETVSQQIYDALQEIADRTGRPEAIALANAAYAALMDRNCVPEDDLPGRQLAYMAAHRDAMTRQLPMQMYMAVRLGGASWPRVAFALGISAEEAMEIVANEPGLSISDVEGPSVES